MSASPEKAPPDAGTVQAWISAKNLGAGQLPGGSSIAQIQFAIVAVCCFAGMACVAMWWRGNGTPWLLGIAGAPIFLSLFFALGYVPVWFLNRSDPAPRASVAVLARACWGEVGAALRVFGLCQPFVWRTPGNALDVVAQNQTEAVRGVVFIHGFFCNRGFWRPLAARLRVHGVPFVAVNLEPAFGSIDRYASILDEAVAAVTAACGGHAPLLVCHSMGGLAARAWLRSQVSVPEHRVLTIGTPHHGTWAARSTFAANARQMKLNSPWLQQLRADELTQRGPNPYGHFTCIYSNADNIVYPASTACLDGAHNVHVPGVAHVHLADSPAVWAAIEAQTLKLSQKP
jgi:triacylglycerol lipase